MIGNLAADVESRTTQSGIAQASFRLAVQRRFANQQGQREADFFQVVCWRGTAEFAARYLAKGRKVAVEGSLQTRSYEAQDGSRKFVTEIIADSVEFCDFSREKQQNASGKEDVQNGFREFSGDDLPF